MNTKQQVLNTIIFFYFTKAKYVEMQKSHTEAHITEILQSRHNSKTGHACRI